MLDVYRNLRKSLEHLWKSPVMFGSRRNTFENLQQCSEVIRNFSDIWVIWIRKSHAFDLGNVGRYKNSTRYFDSAWCKKVARYSASQPIGWLLLSWVSDTCDFDLTESWLCVSDDLACIAGGILSRLRGQHEAMAAEPPILAAEPREASGEAARFRLQENLGLFNATHF